MKHIILLLLCLLIVEISIKFNPIFKLNYSWEIFKKIIYVFRTKNITDNWKEKVIPYYSLEIMKICLNFFLFFLFIFIILFWTDLFIENFILFIFSILGIIEAFVFSFTYIFIRKLFKNE